MRVNKTILGAFLPCLLFLSCGDQRLDDNLFNGLIEYKKVRFINETIIDGYDIKKWAFQEIDSLDYQFVFQLNEDAKSDTIEKYGLGLVYYTDKKFLPQNADYLIVVTQPALKTVGEFKYIIETVSPPAKNLDSIHFFLTGRDGYTGVIGNMVRLKNIKL